MFRKHSFEESFREIHLLSRVLMLLFFGVHLADVGRRIGPSPDVRFRKLTLSEQFFSEGACFADIDADGHNDIVSGPFWYHGPDFRIRRQYASGGPYSIKAYSEHFFSFAHDFNGDSHVDILVIGFPGQPASWYENPGGAYGNGDRRWTRHMALPDVGGESPTLTDLTGDGKPELVCVHGGQFGFAQPKWHAPTQPWDFTSLSNDRGYGVFTHGLGVGAVDNDDRLDVLHTNGWYQQPSNLPGSFIKHQQKFADAGGAQMFAYDFDGDGDNDVVSVRNAHAWGLSWFERRGDEDDLVWLEHPILPDDPNQQDGQPALSQMHALALADIDGDGINDLITGKRFFAHGGGDPGAFQLPELYWFRTARSPQGKVHFEPHLIDRRTGVGTQLSVGDINRDGRNDIVVGNKLGTFVLLNERHESGAIVNETGVAPGTGDFARGVRQSPHLTPQQELETFVLPPGFVAQLVAAEPDITKPLNMAFDSRGRLWVTCTQEYPYPVAVGTPGRDTIKILEDIDGDGRADEITTFADGLNIPIGLYPYKDGVICYSIPYIYFLRDTDGDGKCDQREKLYGPFDHTRDTHGMINALTRGFDGWLYACHGFNNQSTVAGRDGHQVTMHSGNTFRMRLDGSRIEQHTHGQVNPFGMTLRCPRQHVHRRLSFGANHGHAVAAARILSQALANRMTVLASSPAVSWSHLHGSTAIGGYHRLYRRDSTNSRPSLP